METIDMDKKAAMLLKSWNPFNQNEESYATEIVRVIAVLHKVNHPVELAKSIREIYNQASGIWIPQEDCMQISYKLLAVKYEAKSIV